ncbi:MAG: phosphopantothenoylcysteine decarboxylase, partial [Flavobacteriaceae bacterium]
QETLKHYKAMDIAICAAAVADYRPKTLAKQKIKKNETELSLELVKNKDILLALGNAKVNQFLVGFALETENEVENAKRKLRLKNLDAIVLNSLNDVGAGFGTPTNKIQFIDKNLSIKTFDLKTKAEVAMDIWTEMISRLHA